MTEPQGSFIIIHTLIFIFDVISVEITCSQLVDKFQINASFFLSNGKGVSRKLYFGFECVQSNGAMLIN